MGVGIPGTGMIGLPIAVALGASVGKSEYGLEVLKDVTPEAVEKGKEYIAEKRIEVQLKSGAPDRLYIEVHVEACEDNAVVIINGGHTNFVHVQRNGEVLYAKLFGNEGEEVCDDSWLNMRGVYDFATTAPLEEIDFINEACVLNEKAAEESLHGNYGHSLGKVLTRPLGRGIMGDTIFSHILSSTACACDASMAGAMIPIMSNSGSGNQGICVTLPIVKFAEENHNTDEELTRALMLSHLTAIYIKQSLGKLSAFRMRRGFYRIELRHNLSYGWQL